LIVTTDSQTTNKFGTRSCAENSADVLLTALAIATNKMVRSLD
jgi:hypothetical protein